MDHSGEHEWDTETLSRLVVWMQDLTLVLVWLSFTVRVVCSILTSWMLHLLETFM